MHATERFARAREFLLTHRTDYDRAYRDFRWPELDAFNWALDWFDVHARGNGRPALRVVADDGSERARTFAELSETSNRVANALRSWGVRRGDRVLLMLGNELPIWETMLAAMKLGAVVIPATTQLTTDDLRDRFERGAVRHVVAQSAVAERFGDLAAHVTRIAVGPPVAGWRDFDAAYQGDAAFVPDGVTRATDPLLLYFTSGTTARPKLVLHTHQSYPVGHLSTMYWLGLQEGDVHQNISSPGWAKHAWSSLFAPWNAGATVLAHDQRRFDPGRTLELLDRAGVTTL
ncbi:MAG: AMP-dependent synthetase, partial [Myxococcales bacterium]